MNANRRKQINEAIKKLEELDAIRLELVDIINDIATDEEDAFDNLPESIQEGERGELMQEAIDNLQSASDELENIDVETVIDYLTEAQQ